MQVSVMTDSDLRNLLKGNIEKKQRAPSCGKCRRFFIPGDKVFLVTRGDKISRYHVDCWEHRLETRWKTPREIREFRLQKTQWWRLGSEGPQSGKVTTW